MINQWLPGLFVAKQWLVFVRDYVMLPIPCNRNKHAWCYNSLAILPKGWWVMQLVCGKIPFQRLKPMHQTKVFGHSNIQLFPLYKTVSSTLGKHYNSSLQIQLIYEQLKQAFISFIQSTVSNRQKVTRASSLRYFGHDSLLPNATTITSAVTKTKRQQFR